MVVNLDHSKDHKNIAYELFFNSGPLAILPMPSNTKSFFSSSVIWSNTNDYISNLQKLKPSLLIKILEEKIFKYTGNIIKIQDFGPFDLSAHLNTRFYEDRLIYVGDSAHSLHPIAGKGWNLGVRDVKNALISLQKSVGLGLDIGSFTMCKDYHDLSYSDAYSLYQITDKLNNIFLQDDIVSKMVREKGFRLIENNFKIKNLISDFAMGI